MHRQIYSLCLNDYLFSVMMILFHQIHQSVVLLEEHFSTFILVSNSQRDFNLEAWYLFKKPRD